MVYWRNRGKEDTDLDFGVAEVQALLREASQERKEASQFFSQRVMASIEGQEAELSRRARAWAAIPAFASRLSAVAALLLIAAGTWLYTGSHRQSVLSNGIFEDSAAQAASTSQDEVFATPAEESR